MSSNGHRTPPNVERFQAWLVRFGDAWEALDADAVAASFAPGAVFVPDPFSEPVRGKPAIRAHWASLFAEATEWLPEAHVSFSAEVLGAGASHGVAHWRVAGSGLARDGILLAALDASGRCTSLRQWWHRSLVGGAGRA